MIDVTRPRLRALSPAARIILAHLAKEGGPYSHEELAGMAHVSRDTVERCIANLERANLIKVDRERRPHYYTLADAGRILQVA